MKAVENNGETILHSEESTPNATEVMKKAKKIVDDKELETYYIDTQIHYRNLLELNRRRGIE